MKKTFLLAVFIILLTIPACKDPANPDIYPDVQAVLYSQSQLQVYLMIDGSLIVDYTPNGLPVYHGEVDNNGSDQTLYADAVVSLELKSTGELFFTDIAGSITYIFIINQDGIVVEDTQVSGTHSYQVHFINHGSGSTSYTADLIEAGSNTCTAVFSNSGDQVSVMEGSDLYGNLTYVFSFSNASVTREVRIFADNNGDLTGSRYTIL